MTSGATGACLCIRLVRVSCRSPTWKLTGIRGFHGHGSGGCCPPLQKLNFAWVQWKIQCFPTKSKSKDPTELLLVIAKGGTRNKEQVPHCSDFGLKTERNPLLSPRFLWGNKWTKTHVANAKGKAPPQENIPTALRRSYRNPLTKETTVGNSFLLFGLTCCLVNLLLGWNNN